jgi:hypothetical protein
MTLAEYVTRQGSVELPLRAALRQNRPPVLRTLLRVPLPPGTGGLGMDSLRLGHVGMGLVSR